MRYIKLSTDFLLKEAVSGLFYLYNKRTCKRYTISGKLWHFLHLYKYGCYDLKGMFSYLNGKGIITSDIENCCNDKRFNNLFVSTNVIKHSSMISRPHGLPVFTETVPDKIDFVITRHCNLQCKHCFEQSSPSVGVKEIDQSALFDLFDQMELLDVQTLKITGGEPLTSPNIRDVIKNIVGRRLECLILTNGMLLDDELISLISKGAIKLGISLDGISEETHDFIRGKGTFRILFENLHKLKQANINFSITTSLNKKNYREIKDICHYVVEDLHASRLFINQLKPLGRAQYNKSIFLTKEEYRKTLPLIEDLRNYYGDEKVTVSDDRMLDASNDDPNLQEGTPIVCAAGNSTLSIDENLNVYPCVYGNGIVDYKIGNLHESKLFDIWNSSGWDKFRGDVKLRDLEGCRDCRYNQKCAMKNCRLKPVYNGQSFLSHVKYCQAYN